MFYFEYYDKYVRPIFDAIFQIVHEALEVPEWLPVVIDRKEDVLHGESKKDAS